jgi:hypothetical protein
VGTTQEIERQIAARIVTDAIAAGFNISVNDGEETTLRHSKDPAAIESAMFSTDADVLFIYRENLGPLGWVHLIWGNGCDVISDHSDNKAMCDFLAGADKLAEEIQEADYHANRFMQAERLCTAEEQA